MKRLQVIDILENNGTFNKLNYSVPADDFLYVINEFTKEFQSDKSLLFDWINKRQYYMTEIITEWGLCFTYNIAYNHDLLHINSTSDDFHYQYFYRINILNQNVRNYPPNFPRTISTSQTGLWIGFGTDGIEMLHVAEFYGYKIIFHDPYELPSRNSRILNINHKIQSDILIEPVIKSIDESLNKYNPNE